MASVVWYGNTGRLPLRSPKTRRVPSHIALHASLSFTVCAITCKYMSSLLNARWWGQQMTITHEHTRPVVCSSLSRYCVFRNPHTTTLPKMPIKCWSCHATRTKKHRARWCAVFEHGRCQPLRVLVCQTCFRNNENKSTATTTTTTETTTTTSSTMITTTTTPLTRSHAKFQQWHEWHNSVAPTHLLSHTQACGITCCPDTRV